MLKRLKQRISHWWFMKTHKFDTHKLQGFYDKEILTAFIKVALLSGEVEIRTLPRGKSAKFNIKGK